MNDCSWGWCPPRRLSLASPMPASGHARVWLISDVMRPFPPGPSSRGRAVCPPGARPCYPGPVADLVNEFSWSRTRDNAFQDCRRRYFFQYYGAWGGWDAASDPRTRLLYVLKQLGTRQMWAGRLVHEAIERALLRHARRLRALGSLADRQHGAADARGVEGIPRGHLPRRAQAHRPLRARVRGAHPRRGVAGHARQRRPLPAEFPPARRSSSTSRRPPPSAGC